MTSPPTAKAPRAGLSLYANLLDSQNVTSPAPGTISRAPVVFKQPTGGAEGNDDEVSAQRQQPSAASLRFQPTKRPQVANQRNKPKANAQRFGLPTTSASSPRSALENEPNIPVQVPIKATLSDWAIEPAEDDVNSFYTAEKRQRGGRKKRKKNKEIQLVQNWDDIYDPSRPNSYEEYQNSDEKMLEIREWKDRLYAHREVHKRRDSNNSSSNGSQPSWQNSKQIPVHRHRNSVTDASQNFVVAPGLSFAPPTDFGTNSPTVEIVEDATGEDGYARPLRLSSSTQNPTITGDQNMAEPALPPTYTTLQSSSLFPTDPVVRQMQPDAPTISRAPVRYNLPPPPPEIPNTEADLAEALQNDEPEVEENNLEQVPRSLRPGQKGFAERLMSKYGWTKGSGLGASGTGIINPLRVQVEKQKKKPDSEGGGYVGPGGRGKIIGGKKTGEATSELGKFGVMSEVIVLHGMVDGLDLDAEMERAEDGGLLQEIGDECGEKYGRVERVFIDRHKSTNTRVLVKFTSQLSALRAVNALEGRIFNGNAITARFYDREKFDSGNYS
ncbi:MAG: hypothetical protein Q9181_001736 [Wetmoreana brouardii]